MIRRYSAIWLVAACALSGCSSGTGPGTELVTVTGLVTNGGQPVTEFGWATLSLDGELYPLSMTPMNSDGTYGVAAQVRSSDCSRLIVSISLQNGLGQTVAQATERLDSCGAHEVDFDLGV